MTKRTEDSDEEDSDEDDDKRISGCEKVNRKRPSKYTYDLFTNKIPTLYPLCGFDIIIMCSS